MYNTSSGSYRLGAMMNKYDYDARDAFQRRLHRQILWIMMLTSIVNIIGNIIIGYPTAANYKWVVALVIAILMMRYGITSAKRQWRMFGLVTSLVYIMLPAGWYNSGQGTNNALAYLFLLVIVSTILFEGGQRLFLLASAILIFILTEVTGYLMPDLLPQISRQVHFMDRMVQIPMVVLIAAVMLIQFAETLREKHRDLADLNEQLHTMAYTDALTGLGNRGFIFERMDLLINSKTDFVTLMIDMDNFKYVNDTFGHMEGDRLIVRLAETLRTCFGDNADIARYGGDEFIVILQEDTRLIARLCDEFLRQVRHQVRVGDYGATISGGYAAYDGQMEMDMYLRTVDRILYSAKGQGKDQILDEAGGNGQREGMNG